jgi:ribose transport system substrate-binding protein
MPSKPGSLTFAVITKSLNNPAFQVAEKGANDRAAELGGVGIIWTAPTASDPAEEVQMIEGFISKHVDGLIVDSLGPSACAAVDEAMKAGIPVVMWDSDCPDSTRISYVGSDNYKGGYAAGQIYAQAVQGKGQQNIAILTGTPGAFNLGQRDQGFTKALDDLKIPYKVVATVPCYEDLSKAVSAVEDTLRGNSSINGFYFDGPWSLLVDPSNLPLMASKAKAGELTVVSFDTLPPQIQYVKNGSVIGLVGQKYYGWGYQGIQVMYQIVKNKLQYPKFVNMGLDIVTPQVETIARQQTITPDEMTNLWNTFNFKEKPLLPQDVQ